MSGKKSSEFRYEVAPDVSLALQVWEGPDAFTTVLLHGIADAGFAWGDFSPKLAEHCRVLAVDLRGHGDSDHDPLNCYSMTQNLEDMTALLDKLPLNDIVLVGHSMGADIAARIAPTLGSRLRALVVVDSGPQSDGEIATYLRDQLRDSHRRYERPQEYAQWLKERRPLADPTMLDRLASDALEPSPDGGYRLKYDVAVLDMITQGEEDEDWWLSSLRSTTVPVLIVRGMASASLSRQTAERMLAATPRGELATIRAAGHAVMSDNMDAFAQAVIPFIVRVCSPTDIVSG